MLPDNRLYTNQYLTYLDQLQKDGRKVIDSDLVKMFINDISHFASHMEDVVVIVDGVDECPNRQDICELLVQLATKMKVLVVSRREKEIMDVFAEESRLEITEALTSSDIAKHVEWTLEHDPKLKRLEESMKMTIKTHLITKSRGGFALWSHSN
jgi:septum formation inhibitor MinC